MIPPGCLLLISPVRVFESQGLLRSEQDDCSRQVPLHACQLAGAQQAPLPHCTGLQVFPDGHVCGVNAWDEQSCTMAAGILPTLESSRQLVVDPAVEPVDPK